jgi:hypothetical protein
MAADDENRYAAAVQYRVDANYPTGATPGILIRAAVTGDVRDVRKSEMIVAAQRKAAEEFLYILAENALERDLTSGQRVEFKESTPEAVARRRRQLGL